MMQAVRSHITFHPARQRSAIRARRWRTGLASLAAFAAGVILAPVAVHVGLAMMLAEGIVRTIAG